MRISQLRVYHLDKTGKIRLIARLIAGRIVRQPGNADIKRRFRQLVEQHVLVIHPARTLRKRYRFHRAHAVLIDQLHPQNRLRGQRIAVALHLKIPVHPQRYPQAADQLVRYRAHNRRTLLHFRRHRHRPLRHIEARNIRLVGRAAQEKARQTLEIERTVGILHSRIVQKHRFPRRIVAVGKTADFALAHRIDNPQRLRRI